MILLEFVPTYEYECPKCPRVFEVRQRISEPPLATCDRCGGPVQRLLSPAPFILKGGGWYVTDYPSESRKKALKSESSDASSKDATPKESKPAESKSVDSKSPDSTRDSKSSDSKSSTAASESSSSGAPKAS
jgi:putative FmdB family regulatory protein